MTRLIIYEAKCKVCGMTVVVARLGKLVEVYERGMKYLHRCKGRSADSERQKIVERRRAFLKHI